MSVFTEENEIKAIGVSNSTDNESQDYMLWYRRELKDGVTKNPDAKNNYPFDEAPTNGEWKCCSESSEPEKNNFNFKVEYESECNDTKLQLVGLKTQFSKVTG